MSESLSTETAYGLECEFQCLFSTNLLARLYIINYVVYIAYLLELLEEADVVLVEETHICYLILEKSYSLKSDTECESCIYWCIWIVLVVDSAHFEYIWMYHTASKNLDPS